MDTVLDLLMDGMTGVVSLGQSKDWSEAELAQALASVAGHVLEQVERLLESAVEPTQSAVTYLPR